MAAADEDDQGGSKESLNFYSCEAQPGNPPPLRLMLPQETPEIPSPSTPSGPTFSRLPSEDADLILQEDAHSSIDSFTHRRRRGRPREGSPLSRLERGISIEAADAIEMDFDVIQMPKPDNILEANRMANNYMFGFKKWKSHVSQRPLEERSDTVRDLYMDPRPDIRAADEVSMCRPGNILYVILFGWWISLIYLIVGLIMLITIVGYPYSKLCVRMSLYFLWPFGKFVLKLVPPSASVPSTPNGSFYLSEVVDDDERTPLTGRTATKKSNGCCTCNFNHKETSFWKRPSSYIWLLIGVPILFIFHGLAFLLTWITVVFIPSAKINLRAIQKILLMPPDLLTISDTTLNPNVPFGDVLMYTYKAVNLNYYKYTVDGINVIVMNDGLAIVILAIAAGYADEENKIFPSSVKFVLSLISIMPLSYIIGMAISSISAQSNYAVGAVMNATFGSIVEIVLYITAMDKGMKEGKTKCFTELVKSSLVGTLLGTTMLIPGLAMVIGGIKHSAGQRFNPHSAGITATLLFVSVAGTFAPSIFSKAYGFMSCRKCIQFNSTGSALASNHTTEGMECSQCEYIVFGHDGDQSLYKQHVAPLIYTCVTVLPLAYIIGLVYSLHTHREAIYGAFTAELEESHSGNNGHGASWGRIKSGVVLCVAVVLTCVCAEVLTNNIIPILNSGISLYFVGATLVALATAIPEIVVGIQFALQNQISLSIEVGNCTAVQVCMVQIPLLVIANAIHSVGFYLIFNDIHLWTVIIGVLLMNYVFQDGKANYFQGFCLVLTWCILLAMYFFAPMPEDLDCGD